MIGSVSKMGLVKKLLGASLAVLVLASLVAGKPGVGPGDQDWNYVEVRPGAHMFYWLYNTNAAVADPLTRPLVIWLQGGPGASSMYGNFEEFGIVDLDGVVRENSWVNHVNVLFIDNPVGTGWSYVENQGALTTTNLEIATDLVTFTEGFYQQHPEYLDTPLYIFCESYGGKMAPEFALELYKAIQAGNSAAPLQGVALGDPWTSPIDSVLTWAPYLLQTGMVDQEGFERIRVSAESCKTALEAGDFELATDLWGQTENVILTVTRNIDFYNILYKVNWGLQEEEHREADRKTMTNREFLYKYMIKNPRAARALSLEDTMNGPVREVLGDTIPPEVIFDSQGGAVFQALYEDFMVPATDIVEELLNTTSLQVVVFTGQLDLIVDTPGTLDWIYRLKWPGAAAWRQATRSPLTVDRVIEGYTKSTGNFAVYWILRAGHMVPYDNPLAGLKMLQQVTNY